MTDSLDYFKIKEELVVFLRNSDIYTITERGVATTTATGTWTATTSQLINVSNVRNIRSITVAAAPIAYGSVWNVDYYYNDSGTRKCKITMTAQTGAYIITYDYGTDIIFPDFPQANLTINDFPRVGCEIISVATEPGGFGNVNENTITFTVVVYALSKSDLQDTLTTIRQKFIAAHDDFYYIGPWVRPLSTGPLIISSYQLGKNKVFQQNIDFIASFNYEKN